MDVEEWVHCRAKPGVLSLPGLLPPPAPAGATGGRRRRRRGRGVSALPAPQVDGGSSPSVRAASRQKHRQLQLLSTSSGHRLARERGLQSERCWRRVRIEDRVIPCEEKGASVSRRVTQVVLRPVARPTAAQLSSC